MVIDIRKFSPRNAFVNAVCEMATILSRTQCVKDIQTKFKQYLNTSTFVKL